MDKVTRQCPQTTTFLRERRAEAVSNRGPSAYEPNALPLGQTGSLKGKKVPGDFKFGCIIGPFPSDGAASMAVKGLNVQMNSKERKLYSDSDSDSLFTKFYNKESVSKAVSIQT